MSVACKKRREKSLPWRKDITLNASLRRRDEARDGAGAAESVHQQCVVEARDVKIELVPWSEQQQ